MKAKLFIILFLFPLIAWGEVKVGIDVLFEEADLTKLLQGKHIGLITNQTAINHAHRSTFDLLKENQKNHYKIKAVFAPEHGFHGEAYACEEIKDQQLGDIPLYGLHGQHRRPTKEMLAGIDLLIYDVQDIGTRSYTYASTLFYCIEEAAKQNIPLLVLDRPNPMGGVVVDGPLLEDDWRSFLGYVNVPYCHGMTIGELATLFNEEYKIGCRLSIAPMKGWKRGMTFAATGLPWMPTSPQIPEQDTPFYYPTTGLIGHCSLSSIGIGYTLPFKLIGAPWIHAEQLARSLNSQKLPGVHFQPFYFRPFFGKFKLENCKGVRILVTDPSQFLPVTTQFTIIGVLKTLYPRQFEESIQKMMASKSKKETFHKLCGSEEILRLICEEQYIIWNLRTRCQQARETFMPIRMKYLLY